METRRDVFQAIADPTRRAIIHLISQEPVNVNTIADNFNVSRPAISQHVKILTECGLIQIRKHGRERYCEAKFEKLKVVSDWVDQYKKIWLQQFASLEKLLAELQQEKPAKKKNQTKRK